MRWKLPLNAFAVTFATDSRRRRLLMETAGNTVYAIEPAHRSARDAAGPDIRADFPAKPEDQTTTNDSLVEGSSLLRWVPPVGLEPTLCGF